MARPKGIPSTRKGKTFEEIYGTKRAKEIRKKSSESHIGQKGYWAGRELPKKTRQKIGKANSVSLIGRKLSNESRLKMSLSHVGMKYPYNPRYSTRKETAPLNRRVRRLAKSQDWRKEVFERDDYECCCCLGKDNLHAHHINEFSRYPEERFDITNGLTLCKDCHFSLHRGAH